MASIKTAEFSAVKGRDMAFVWDGKDITEGEMLIRSRAGAVSRSNAAAPQLAALPNKTI